MFEELPCKNPVLLCDADVMLYHALYRNGVKWAMDEDQVFDIDGALVELNELVEDLVSTFGAHEVIMCVSASNNFRRELTDTYKANRKEKPQEVKDVYRRFLEESPFRIERWNRLEADDVLGILHTGIYKDASIIVTSDKDLKTVPGLHVNPYKLDGGDEENPDWKVTCVSPSEAVRFHRYQTLVGDSTDNIKGCPRVGKVKADKILDEDNSWDAVLDAYVKSGLDETDFLLNARLTHILQDGEYNMETAKIKLWKP